MAPMAVMTLGTMAMVADPGGAIVGLWQPGDHKGFGVFNEPNSPGWFELHTAAYDATVAFYEKAFGFAAHVAADEPGFRYTTYGEGEHALAGIMDAAAFGGGAPAGWSVYFRVDDADKAVARAQELGATVVSPAEDTPYGRLAHLDDPTGASFKLMA
jgi:predicted enzyme related to lactoylglutathione lyase